MLPGASWAPSWLPTSKSSSIFRSWAPSWRLLGPSWEDLGRSWRTLGKLLSGLGALLGSSWGALGRTFGDLEWLGCVFLGSRSSLGAIWSIFQNRWFYHDGSVDFRAPDTQFGTFGALKSSFLEQSGKVWELPGAVWELGGWEPGSLGGWELLGLGWPVAGAGSREGLGRQNERNPFILGRGLAAGAPIGPPGKTKGSLHGTKENGTF